MTTAILSWSSGKDSAWALHVARQTGLAVTGLFTTVNETFSRVAVHGVRREVLRAQADAVGLPLTEVDLPYPCSNEVYEARTGAALARLVDEGLTDMVFGDLFLADIRAYREAQLKPFGITPHFPLWGRPTDALAREMIDGGTKAVVATLDPSKLPKALAGRDFDAGLLADLPAGTDPCAENGEFHTLVWDGPAFAQPVPLRKGETVERDGFVYTDFDLA
ncbi:MAG: adenine nucleotide alpha hydrolase [Paracoccaceae bacterium]|nr:adenine nucleotide alpha hydrolase [Paracoccaceae bacterium]